MIFPKLAAKFGNEITYVEAPKQHVITEFSFDIVQAPTECINLTRIAGSSDFASPNRFSSEAFVETYGLEMKDVFASEDRAISTYRYAVSQIIPALTRAAWQDKHDEIATLTPNCRPRIYLQVPADRL